MKITFIGGGNMASSLVGGLIADGFDANLISIVDINEQRLQYFSERFGVNTSSTIATAIDAVSTIVLSVKPQALKSVALELATLIKDHNVLIISIAAGIRTADIGTWLGDNVAIVRAMPNTPALVNCGASALYANEKVNTEQREAAESILRATGLALWVDDEAQMNTVTALSGSGPAYFFRIMETMQNAAIELGMAEETARLLTLQTALGAAKLAMESSDDLATLREAVTSPGGTTEQGLEAMNNNNIDNVMAEVIQAAHKRAVEIADQLGES
jgi:pyrroline-5-carboxylate reductase